MKGDGCLYQRGKVWWARFYVNGVAHSISCRTTIKADAQARLRDEVRKSRTDEWVSPEKRRVLISDLVASAAQHYRAVKIKPAFAAGIEARWRLHLEPVFGNLPAAALDAERITAYRAQRATEGASPTTINRELQCLSAAFKLARKFKRIVSVPVFSWAPEDNARLVFISKDVENKLKAAAAGIDLWHRTLLEVAFTYGWRKGELMQITPAKIDFSDGAIRIGRTKNGEPREVPLTPSLRAMLEALTAGMAPDKQIFTDQRIDLGWQRICKAAGVPCGKRNGGYVLHDVRRSSARNKAAAGIPTHVIMKMQGWTTDEMFRRYAIVDRSTLARALEQEQRERPLATDKLQSTAPGSAHISTSTSSPSIFRG